MLLLLLMFVLIAIWARKKADLKQREYQELTVLINDENVSALECEMYLQNMKYKKYMPKYDVREFYKRIELKLQHENLGI